MAELRGNGLTKVFEGGVRALDGVSFTVPSGTILLNSHGFRFRIPAGAPPGAELSLGIRPEDVEIYDAPAPGTPKAEVAVNESLGLHNLLTLRVQGGEIRALVPPRDWAGEVGLHLPEGRLHWFERETGRRVAG